MEISSQLEMCDLSGNQRKRIEVPGIGSIGGVSAEKKYVSCFSELVSSRGAYNPNRNNN